MARIRTIKPDFWDSPDTARASLRARLLYIAMWNWADDWGVGDAHPLRLLSFAFPNDESSEVEPRNFRTLASEVAECFGVQWYEVDGRAFYAIPSWEDHQRTEKKARRKNPSPDQAFCFLYEKESENPPLNRGNRHDGRGKGEVGSRKGEVDSLSPEVSDDRPTLLPDDWQPNQSHRDKAVSLHLDVDRELFFFRDHAHRKQRRMKNWNTAFTNWLRKSAEFAQERQGHPRPQPKSRMQGVADMVSLGRQLDSQQGEIEQ